MSALIEDVNKTIACQRYNIVKKIRNWKNKYDEVKIISLRFGKKGLYKEDKTYIKYKTCEKVGNV